MEKYHRTTARVIAILLMLTTAPLAVTYSYAENEEETEPRKLQEISKSSNQFQKKPGVFQSEKLVNGNLDGKELTLPENATKNGMNRILSLEGTSGWSYIDYTEYHSGIVIFDGKTSEVEEKHWKISVDGKLNLSKGEIDLKFVGKSIISDSKDTDDLSQENLGYKVIFSGKLMESDEKGEFAFAVMNAAQKNSDFYPETKIQPFGNPALDSGNSFDGNQRVGNTIF